MSGHESHGHGGHEDHGHGHGDHGHHGPVKVVYEPITDEYMNRVNASMHAADEEILLKKDLASGKLPPEIEKEALKMIEKNRRIIAGAKFDQERAVKEISNMIESKKLAEKKIADLQEALRTQNSTAMRNAIQHKIDGKLHEIEVIQQELDKNKENVLDVEAIKHLDDTRSAYAKEYKKQYGNAKKERRIENIKIGLFNAGRFVKNQFRKEEYKKDFLEKKKDSDFISPELESKKTEYDVARLALANRMYERREAELLLFAEKNNVDPLEIKRRLAEYRTKDIIQKTFLDEKIKFRKESGIPEHGVVLRVLHWYGNQPRWKKIALSTALFTAGGAAGVLPFAAGAIAKYGIISYTGMRFGASALTGGIVANAVKIIDVINKEKDDKFKEDQKTFKEKQDKKFVNEEINQIQYEKQLERLDRKENTKLKKRMLVKSGVGVFIGAGTGALVYNTIYDNIRFQDVDNPVPPTTKGIHITKEPEKIIQINPENPQIKTPEIKTQPHTIIQMIPDDYEPRPSITADKDVHITAEETNIEQVKPEAQDLKVKQINPETNKPMVDNSGDELKIKQVNPEDPTQKTQYDNTNQAEQLDIKNENIIPNTEIKINYSEVQKIQEGQLDLLKEKLGEKSYNKLIKDLESKNIPYKSDSSALRTISVGEHTDMNGSFKFAQAQAYHQILEQTGQKSATFQNSIIKEDVTFILPGGEYRNIVVIETPKVNGQNIEKLLNTELISDVENSTQNQIPEINNTQPEVGGSGQTAFEYRESLIKQSATSMEHFKNTSGLSDGAIKQMLTPSDKNHTRIIIEKSSRDLATAQKMIDYDLRNIKAVSEDYKHVIERKVYNDGSGYHIYEVIEFKK